MNDFTDPNSDIFIFLLSTRSGGLGINLASADTVILYDSDWNPQMDLQAMDRAHRIGQKNVVNVYRFITKGTVEEQLNEKQLFKLKWDQLVVKSNMKNQNKTFSKEEIRNMIDFGISDIFNSEKGTYTDEDIDLILQRGEKNAEENEKKIEGYLDKHKNILDLNKDYEAVSMYHFDDVDYRTKMEKNIELLKELRENERQNEQNDVLNNKERRVKLEPIGEEEVKEIFDLSLEEIMKLPGVIKRAEKKFPIRHFYENRERLIELQIKRESYYIINREISNRDKIYCLTESECEEMEKLAKTGLKNWDSNDLKALLNAIEQYSIEDYENISKVFFHYLK